MLLLPLIVKVVQGYTDDSHLPANNVQVPALISGCICTSPSMWHWPPGRYNLTVNTSLRPQQPLSLATIGTLIAERVPDAVHLRTSGAEVVRICCICLLCT